MHLDYSLRQTLKKSFEKHWLQKKRSKHIVKFSKKVLLALLAVLVPLVLVALVVPVVHLYYFLLLCYYLFTKLIKTITLMYRFVLFPGVSPGPLGSFQRMLREFYKFLGRP